MTAVETVAAWTVRLFVFPLVAVPFGCYVLIEAWYDDRSGERELRRLGRQGGLLGGSYYASRRPLRPGDMRPAPAWLRQALGED